ncbi:Non-specific serine/threonine protein kinase [Bertholletia excelsa]
MSCFPFCFRKKVASPSKEKVQINLGIAGGQNVKLYSYKELCIATENFSPANKIGEGGYGSVYKGTLQDGTLAAIKVLSAESSQGVREFLTEIIVISVIEHENLVKLYGCCVEGGQRILVYGYLENKSLAETLLGNAKWKPHSIQFNWKTRSKICIGIAQGLAFLHEEVQPRIVHRDIKASNILLDRDLTPMISDFGLAKLFPCDLTYISTRVAGTLGYLAPEYAIRGKLTSKADVYSFGVLLLEIVSGRCHTNKQLPDSEHYLLERAWRLYEKGELESLVDASLDGDSDVNEACKFLKIGLLCTQDMQKERPSMSKVVKMLKGEMDINDQQISKPGLISELMGLKTCKDTSSLFSSTTTSTSAAATVPSSYGQTI